MFLIICTKCETMDLLCPYLINIWNDSKSQTLKCISHFLWNIFFYWKWGYFSSPSCVLLLHLIILIFWWKNHPPVLLEIPMFSWIDLLLKMLFSNSANDFGMVQWTHFFFLKKTKKLTCQDQCRCRCWKERTHTSSVIHRYFIWRSF